MKPTKTRTNCPYTAQMYIKTDIQQSRDSKQTWQRNSVNILVKLDKLIIFFKDSLSKYFRVRGVICFVLFSFCFFQHFLNVKIFVCLGNNSCFSFNFVFGPLLVSSHKRMVVKCVWIIGKGIRIEYPYNFGLPLGNSAFVTIWLEFDLLVRTIVQI